MKKSSVIKVILVIAILLAIISIGYFMFFFTAICESGECFSSAMIDCKRVSYIKDAAETITYYEILGKKDNRCQIKVKLLQVKQGPEDLGEMEGKEMICNVPLGVYTSPESNLKECHGRLKEEIQEIMIQRMHSQLVENIGEIQGITKVL